MWMHMQNTKIYELVDQLKKYQKKKITVKKYKNIKRLEKFKLINLNKKL